MSWLERCYETYENCQQEIGIQKFQAEGDKRSYVPLLPVAHTTQLVNIEVELDQNGNFQDARLLAKDEQTTIIPCTDKSSARTSNKAEESLAPHPLVDSLQYVAAEYKKYGGKKTYAWPAYHAQLKGWCESEFAHPAVCAVLKYLEKECLISDLLKKHILFTDASGKLPDAWNSKAGEKPLVLKTLAKNDQTASVVRFRVENVDLSKDKTVWESYIHYYETKQQRVDYCTVQGEQMAISAFSPYKIRGSGDRAKLISSNDDKDFTFRGRFENAEQALSIGYETTQKAHSALRWLISKQGCSNGDQTVVVWGTKGEPIPDITADSMDLGDDFAAAFAQLGQPQLPPATESEYAERFNKAIQGYGKALDAKSDTVVMILEAATVGRLSIRYYRELKGSQLMENITDWHKIFSWRLEYKKVQDNAPAKGSKQPKEEHTVTFVGAPAPADIAKAAYGENADDKIIQETVERLIPCIVEKRPLPRDLMLSAVRRATVGFDRKTTAIACALIRGYYCRNEGKEFSMESSKINADERITNDRSYRFGCILAYAEQIERCAQSSNDANRPTNAERLKAAFVQRPSKTLELLDQKLTPYIISIRANGNTYVTQYKKLLDVIVNLDESDFSNDPLNELYLLGYARTMHNFWHKDTANNENAKAKEE